ncbi:PIG-L deacetylase family protein [Sandarakinorhabdus glacialis]|uniref:PIG-L deacetylase family protein n=1 Tax=Sandarakinorhabdus glacialis TaxID=1614636 RepID=UPI001FB10A50|nr:PIG-L family deacetylase [Polymorphobacter glacialis]
MTNSPAAPLFQPRNSPSPHAETLSRWHAAAAPVTIDALLGNARSLGVVVPHADDETLGCGGLIAAAADRGLAVHVTVLTDGAASHPGSVQWPPARLRAHRRTEAAAVAILTRGRGTMGFADAPDGALADYPETADKILGADLLVTRWQGDPHPDHQAAFRIARAAAERLGAQLIAFPLWVLTTVDGPPAHRLVACDVDAALALKRAALAAHRSQLGNLVEDCRGFVLDDELQALFVRAEELYLVIR